MSGSVPVTVPAETWRRIQRLAKRRGVAIEVVVVDLILRGLATLDDAAVATRPRAAHRFLRHE